MIDTPFDTPSPTPTAGDNPFLDLPTGPSGRPRITIRPLQGSSDIAPSPGNSASGPTTTTESGDLINNAQNVPYAAGADNTTPDYSHIDKRIPQYSDRVLDSSGVPADLYKYLNIHEQTERQLMDTGIPYDQAHDVATKRENAAVQSDGVDPGDYEKLMTEYAKKTESEHPAHAGAPPGVYPGPYQGSGAQPSTPSNVPASTSVFAPNGPSEPSMPSNQPVDQQDIEDAAHEFTRAEMVRQRSFGGLTSLMAGLNLDLVKNFYNPILQGVQAMPANVVARGAQGAVQAYKQGGLDAAEKFGLDFLRNPMQNAVTGDQLFDMARIPRYDDNTYMNSAGQATSSVLATALAIHLGTRALTKTLLESGAPITSIAGRVAGIAAKKYSDAISADPARYYVSELMGGWGSVMGGEGAMDVAHERNAGPGGEAVANVLGSTGGAVVGGGGVGPLARKAMGKGLQVSKFFARKAQEAANALSHLTGMGEEAFPKEFGMQGPKPQVDPDVLNNARHLESVARQKGDNVVQARLHLEKQIPQTHDWLDAQARQFDAQQEERAAISQAEKAWKALPEEARNEYSHQQNALRSEFAETNYPTTFAKKQVEGDKALIDDKISGVFKDLEPGDLAQGVAGYSTKISDGIWDLRDQAKGMLDKYWKRAPLKQKINGTQVLKAVDQYLKNATDMPDSVKPMAEIEQLREQFGPIKVRNQSPLSYLKNFMTLLHQKADTSYRAGNNLEGAQYDTLHSNLYDAISLMFPDNVALQQAREVSTHYFDYFTRSELGKILTSAKSGASTVHQEDVLSTLVNRARGFNDLSAAIDFLDKKGVVKIGDPTYVSKDQKANIDGLKQNVIQGIKAHLQDYFQKVQYDPKKAAQLLNSPEFQKRISAFAPALADAQAAGDELNTAILRRKAIEDSALAKYVEFGDPDVAINKVWNNSDPAAMAKDLMDGIVGVGGFRSDPIAMEGFKSALLDKLVSTSVKSVMSGAYKGQSLVDFGKITTTLAGPCGRLLKQVLSNEEWDRLNRLVERGKTLEGVQAKKEQSDWAVKWLAQYGALHLQRFLPHVGEGGELKKASLVSAVGGQVAENFLQHAVPPGLLFKGAISNPALEQIMYNNVPVERQAVKAFARTIRSGVVTERAAVGYYQNWLQYGDGPKAPAPRAESDQPYSWLDFSPPANAMTTEQGQGYEESASRMIRHERTQPSAPDATGR